MNCVLLAKMDQVFSKENRTLKILENWKKYWKSQGILSTRKSGNPESKRIKKGSCDSQLEIPLVLLILSIFQFPYL